MTTFIYVLLCPRSGEVRYIGKSNNIASRLAVHQSNARRCAHTFNARWMKSIEDAGLKVEAVSIHAVRGDVAWQVMERLLIASAKCFGMRINNGTNGGEGVDLDPSDMERVKALRRAGVTQEVRRRMASSVAASWKDEDVRRRRVEAMRRACADSNSRERLKAIAKIPRSDQAKANRLAAVAAYWSDPANRAKAAERMRAIGLVNAKKD